jgi:hypothetical protein
MNADAYGWVAALDFRARPDGWGYLYLLTPLADSAYDRLPFDSGSCPGAWVAPAPTCLLETPSCRW